MTAFPQLKNYFEDCFSSAIEKGYILFNKVTKRKYFIHNFKKLIRLQDTVEQQGFWDLYKFHKRNKTYDFTDYYKPIVREYFKLKGIIYRHSLNYPIQGTSADITKLAGVYYFDTIIENGLFNKVLLSNIVHDEYVAECSKDLSEDQALKLKECMEKSGEVFCKTVKLSASPVITKFWNH